MTNEIVQIPVRCMLLDGAVLLSTLCALFDSGNNTWNTSAVSLANRANTELLPELLLAGNRFL
jgi:hypothetical protein